MEIFQLGTSKTRFWSFYFKFLWTVNQVLWPRPMVSRNFQLISRNAKSNFRNYMHAHKSIRICWKWQSFLTKFKQFSASVFFYLQFLKPRFKFVSRTRMTITLVKFTINILVYNCFPRRSSWLLHLTNCRLQAIPLSSQNKLLISTCKIQILLAKQ